MGASPKVYSTRLVALAYLHITPGALSHASSVRCNGLTPPDATSLGKALAGKLYVFPLPKSTDHGSTPRLEVGAHLAHVRFLVRNMFLRGSASRVPRSSSASFPGAAFCKYGISPAPPIYRGTHRHIGSY